MNINFGLIAPWDGPRIRGKREESRHRDESTGYFGKL